MKIKALLATLVGAVAINGVTAGEWCPPDKGGYEEECPIEVCPDVGGSVSVGYDTDYIWKGVRWARDSVWADVNYTFADMVNVGVWHLSSLGSAVTDVYGDETNIYASVGLPEMMGMNAELGYVLNLFPTQRGPSGTPGNVGDSFQRVYLSLQRELMGGISFGYTAEYYFGSTQNTFGTSRALGDWFHTAGLYKTVCLTDSISLDVSAEVGYTDSLWSGLGIAHPGGVSKGSGFNHYNIKVAMPIALNCRATLTPYVAYNGTPDAWKADELDPGTFSNGNNIFGIDAGQDPNFNDVFYGGVSLNVKF